MSKKYELKIFNPKMVKYIQKKYKAELKTEKNKLSEKAYREEMGRFKEILIYKKMLDLGKIKEEDIPKEYVEELRKIYEEQIMEVKSKIQK